MFECVNIDWRISHDDGSTDFSDDETLDDHSGSANATVNTTGTISRLNGSRTPDKNAHLSPDSGKASTLGRTNRPLSVATPTKITSTSPI